MRLFFLIACVAVTSPGAIADVTIEAPGADKTLQENLRTRLELADEPCDAPGWRVRRLFSAVEEDLQPGLHAFGYYRATIDKDLDTADPKCWHAKVAVELGERVTVRKRSVAVQGEAKDDPAMKALLADLPLAKGAPLNHGEYEAIKDRLRALASQRGYFDFAFSRQQLRVYPDDAAAEIDLVADSGPRYRFGEIRIGEQPLDRQFIDKLTQVREGEPYNARQLTALDRSLNDAGYFQRVEVRALFDEKRDGAVPIEIVFDPQKRHAWRFGVGYATDTGPRGTVRYDNRYVNDVGHQFKSELRLSPVESGLTADYTVPGEKPLLETYSFGARLLHEETETADSDSITLFARQQLKTCKWKQTRFLEWMYEDSTVGDDNTSSYLLMPGISFERLEADDPLRTYRGYRIFFETRAAHENLLSSASFVQLRADLKGIYRFGDAGRLTSRIEIGATIGDSIDNLPASLRFFAGGDNSVRGYEYESLGPVNDDGDVIGGRHLLTGSIEYEHPVFEEDWWVAAFIDAGNAFNSDEIDPKVGYGIGVRWYSPVGRLRVDLAFPDDTSEDDWRFHIGLGADL
ncbi:autotransporter assembly complex protein TamA [Thiosocius teredinicola]|uniref:autotransporter assembly complex protein TamA n=1 Tax=Thiosocius teredinicola TaxID=1973002 RepID=UPI000F78FACE